MPSKEPFLMCIAAGLFMNVARKVTAETASEERKINPNDTSSQVAKSRFEAILASSKANKYKSNTNSSSNSNTLTAPYKTLKDGMCIYTHLLFYLVLVVVFPNYQIILYLQSY